MHESASGHWTKFRKFRGPGLDYHACRYASCLRTEHSGEEPTTRLKDARNLCYYGPDHRRCVVNDRLDIDIGIKRAIIPRKLGKIPNLEIS